MFWRECLNKRWSHVLWIKSIMIVTTATGPTYNHMNTIKQPYPDFKPLYILLTHFFIYTKTYKIVLFKFALKDMKENIAIRFSYTENVWTVQNFPNRTILHETKRKGYIFSSVDCTWTEGWGMYFCMWDWITLWDIFTCKELVSLFRITPKYLNSSPTTAAHTSL